MIKLPAKTRIFISAEPCDMRKQHFGLASLVVEGTGAEPRTGGLYVFWNRRRDMLKVLFRDMHGYCLLAKRLERGAFRINLSGSASDGPVEIGAGQLTSLMRDLSFSPKT